MAGLNKDGKKHLAKDKALQAVMKGARKGYNAAKGHDQLPKKRGAFKIK